MLYGQRLITLALIFRSHCVDTLLLSASMLEAKLDLRHIIMALTITMGISFVPYFIA